MTKLGPDVSPTDDTLLHDPDGGMERLVAIMARLRDPV